MGVGFAAIIRPAQDFMYARQKKGFWIGILLASLLVTGNGWLYRFPLPFSGLLSLAAIFAAVYFLGPENQRMGPRRQWRRLWPGEIPAHAEAGSEGSHR